jgi:hypothetical protein
MNETKDFSQVAFNPLLAFDFLTKLHLIFLNYAAKYLTGNFTRCRIIRLVAADVVTSHKTFRVCVLHAIEEF